MAQKIILASGSATRQQMLKSAGVSFDVVVARIDEDMVKAALEAEQAKPREIADTLAEMKARKVSDKFPEALVIGCDQVLDLGGAVLSKPDSPEAAITQLKQMRGKRHSLLSAVVICEGGRPIWRHVGQVRMLMRPLTDGCIDEYVARNWESIQHSVGAYKLEEEGMRLFSKVEGEYFCVLGLPLLELLSYLILRGDLQQ